MIPKPIKQITMLKNILPLGVALLMAFTSNAQLTGLYGTSMQWADKPTLHKMPANFKDASAVYLIDNRIYQYKFEDKNLVQSNYVYKLIKVADDKGIEMFNKIYIPVSLTAEVNDIRARVITSSGAVLDVPASKIKDQEIEGNRYKFFAMEGLDKGSEVEYSYVTRKNPSFFGSEIFQNKSTPYAQVRVSIVIPKHLKFDAKGFNGFTVLKDSLIGEQRVTAAYSENIQALEDEKYGLPDPYFQRLDFKLSYNLSVGKSDSRMYTWNELGKNVFNNLTRYSEKETKALNKFMKGANIADDESQEQTIRLLEDYMKNKINVDDKLVSEDAENIEAIIKTGNTNNLGAFRFFIAMLENKQIPYQIVFPSVRDQLPLVEDIENWNRIDEMLVYFPSTHKFLQPAGASTRYPYVEPYWAGTRGLFLKITSIGDVRTAIAKFDTIPMEPFDQNGHNMEVSVKVDPSGDSLIIESKQILTGYAALAYKPIWAYLTVDKQEEAVKDIINSVAKSENIQQIKTEHTKFTDSWDNKPLVISGTIHTAELLEKAGNKLLLKFGELIGPQEQMYQEKPRQLPAELQYPHILYRKLKFQVPDGYTIKNLKDLNMDFQVKRDNIVTMGFTSNYTMTGNELVVEVMETYHEIKYPLSEFESFKKVINASADFNKVVLVLEKK